MRAASVNSAVWRWVQKYAPAANKRMRPYLKMSGASYRVDEPYIKVGKSCKYLYHAVDKNDESITML
ncbi:MAG: transposase, family [Acidobacteriota bacterium]|jgi:transposase-like protein|nr:transposase, family [Acidobacteriota bacterium]